MAEHKGAEDKGQAFSARPHTWQGMVHVFPSNITLLHAAKAALDDIGDFFREQLVNEPANKLEQLPA